jgi:DNA polymerase-3 subunit delta
MTPFFGKEPAGIAGECAKFLNEPLPPEISVLIDGPGVDQRKTLAKNWKKAGCSFESCNTIKTNDKKFADNRKLNIRDLCAKWGKSIDPAAVQYLSETIGGDSGLLANELEKLSLYTGDRPRITLEDCQAVCCRTPETVSWEFTGAITSGNTELALKLLGLLLQEKDSEMRLMATLSGEFQKLIQTRLAMKELQITRVTPRTFDSLGEDIKNQFPGNPLLKLHPFRAYKVCENAAAFSDAQLAQALEAIRNAARSLVSGGGDRRMTLEQLVIKLTCRSVL